MKVDVKNVVILGACVALLSGCATIINDKTQRVNVTTSNGAKVSAAIDGMPVEAPGVAVVTRAKAERMVTTSDSRCAQTTAMPSTVDNVFFINILSGGLFGSTTDYATDKMWKYQDTVTISCKN